MDQSLDDIIKSKHIKPNFRNRPGSQNGKPNPSQKPFVLRTANRIPQNGRAKIIDARQKIIDKTRSTVIDARSRITQKDARLKLNKVLESKNSRISKPRDLRGKLKPKTSSVLPPIGIIQRTVQSDLGYLGLGPPTITVPIQRTIRNNFTPSYGVRAPIVSHLDMEWNDLDSPIHVDPVVRPDPHLYHSSSDLYHKPMDVHATRTVRNDLVYHRESSRNLSRRSDSPPLRRSLSPPTLISRLDTHSHEVSRSRSSAGIFARSTSERRAGGSAGILGGSITRHVEGPAQAQQVGHRIVVSNLKDSVNSDDIKELFEDIGPLIASRVVRPGTAEVIYARQSDAIKAVETYHNRQLDKQPMKCMLVTPRATTNPLVPAGPKLPTAAKSNTIQPDLAAVYKALFNKPSQVYK